MSGGFTVDPERLFQGATATDQAVEALGAAALAVARLGRLDTGRQDSALLTSTLLQQLAASVQGVAEEGVRDAQALRTAGVTYAVAELRAGGDGACG